MAEHDIDDSTQEVDEHAIVRCLLAYNQEAETNRRDREEQWRRNWNVYWQRHDFSKKAPWQYQLVMPEGPTMIERFAGSIKKSLVQAGRWYTVEDPSKKFSRFVELVRTVVDYWLSRAGETITSGTLSFLVPFEEALKDGAIMMMASTVTWKILDRPIITVEDAIEEVEDPDTGEIVAIPSARMRKEVRPEGVISVEAVDPRTVWVDHTGRGLYRRRRIEMDLHELQERAEKEVDIEGNPLWDRDAIDELEAFVDTERSRDRQESSNTQTGTEQTTYRKPIVLDEYICTVLNSKGQVARFDGEDLRDVYIVMANEETIVRGPEPNPFLHGQDWLVWTPVLRVRGAPYGRSYVEAWERLVVAFTDYINQVMDSTQLSGMKAFAGDPSVLQDPDDLKEGLHGNKYYKLETGRTKSEFIDEINLGSIDGGAVQILGMLKNSIQEGGVLNDLMLGNLPKRGERTATEINTAAGSAGAFITAIAESIEQGYLEPILSRIWWVALQHMSPEELPRDLYEQLMPEYEELLNLPYEMRLRLLAGPYRFTVRGLSGVLQKQVELQQLLTALSVVTGSRELTRAMIMRVDPLKLFDEVMRGFGVRVESIARDAESLPPDVFMGSDNAQDQAALAKGQMPPGEQQQAPPQAVQPVA
jgi:hypothetical protein